MGNATTRAKLQTVKIGKEPLVLVPLSMWRRVEDILEDQEALASARYVRRIRTARRDIAAGKSVYPFR
jgi:PHD/YefM family antitoxin component YafN of YafNO toxin-antitoxin module